MSKPTIKKISVKRLQLDKSNKTMYLTLVVCSIATALSLVALRSFTSEATYYRRIVSKKEKAVSVLKKNESALATLQASYRDFVEQDPNALGGRLSGVADRDGDNAKLVLDALPSSYDFPALTASLEKLLTGYKIDGISGTDDSISQSELRTPGQIIEIPFTVSVTTDYEGAKKLLDMFDRSIRPFYVKSIDISGQSNSLLVTINAKTFYQSPKSMEIKSEIVK